MKNKFLLCACMVALTAAMFTSCKKHTDLTESMETIARKNLPGIYAYVGVDRENVSTTLYEWALDDNQGDKKGYYRIASTGNGLDSDTTINLTWAEASMNSEGNAMIIPVELPKTHKDLVWNDGVVEVDGYVTYKSLISVADVLRTVHGTFANLDLVHNDTVDYITSRMDTLIYLAWKTQVVSYTQEQIDSAKNAMIEYADTLAWFNATYPSRAVPDTVRFSTKPQADGTYKGQVSVPYEDMDIKEIKTNHGHLHIVNSRIIVNRVGLVNTGSYYFHEQTWTEECYTKPTTKQAVYTDYVSDLSGAKWTPSAFTNAKKFNILFKGKRDMTLISKVAGEDQKPEEMHETDYFFELPFYNYNKEDGEIMLDGRKYKNIK